MKAVLNFGLGKYKRPDSSAIPDFLPKCTECQDASIILFALSLCPSFGHLAPRFGSLLKNKRLAVDLALDLFRAAGRGVIE